MTVVDKCAACGEALSPGARFCRSCGSAVESTEVSGGGPDAAGAHRSQLCPSCAAPVSAGELFCRSCGERLHAGEAPAASPPASRAEPVESSPPHHVPSSPHPPSPPPPRRGRGPLIAAGAFLACLALGGLVGGGAYLLSQDSEPDDSMGSGPIWSGPGTGGGAGGSSTGGGGGGDRTGTPNRSGENSPLAPGRYVQAGSFRSPEGAGREVDRLLGSGVDVEAVPADWADELLPGFQVLLVGPLATNGEEKRALRQLEEANVAGFGRDLTPSEAVPGPEVAAGEWSGELERSHLRGERRPGAYAVAFEIAADGESGTVEHLDRGCTGSLSLIEDSGYSLAYAESIGSGDCPLGGVWHLRPEGGEVTAVWLHDDVQVLIDGDAPASGG